MFLVSELKHMGDDAFSLVELLIVMAMGALLVSLVGPASVSLYDHYSLQLARNQVKMIEKRAQWEAFIRQKSCRIKVGSSREQDILILTCSNEQVVHQNINAVLGKDSFFENLPLCFNRMGAEVPCKILQQKSLSTQEKQTIQDVQKQG